jgi:uncharacterized protein (DUF2062 family)
VNELLYVTGTLGDSRAGLEILAAKHNEAGRARLPRTRSVHRFLLGRHYRPAARIHEGRWLATSRLATAAIDLSDGLSGDVRHLSRESGVGVEIDRAALPISRACRLYAQAKDRDPADYALGGGEDYEILCTVKTSARTRFEAQAARRGFRFTCIGTTRPQAFGLRIRTEGGSLQPLAATSYEHFVTSSREGATRVISLTDFRSMFRQILHLRESPHRTALAFAVGVFIGFSPTYGLHMVMVAFCTWAFGLNFVALLAGAFLNNPWTLVPILGATFWTGALLMGGIELPAFRWDNLTAHGIYDQVMPYAAPFFVGGLALSVLGALVSYPFAYYLISKYRAATPADSRAPLPPRGTVS